MEEGVVEVSFATDGIEGTTVPGADFLDEVGAEVCAFLVLGVVVEVDLVISYLISS